VTRSERSSPRLGLLLLLLLAAGSVAMAQACVGADERAAVEAVRARIDGFGDLTWPGWTGAPPMLVRSGDVDCLLDHPAPPAGFVAVGPGVARLDGHVLPVPAATAFDVGGVWSVVVPTRAELQAFVDEHLGRGLVVLDEGLYQRTLLHEAFHAFQMTVMGGPAGMPDFAAGPAVTLAEVASHTAFDAAQSAQGAALHEAIVAPTAGEAVAAVERFLGARDAWRAVAPAGTEALELQLEWLEGTARYADVLLALIPAPEPLGRGGDAWVELLAQVRGPASVASGARDRYAALGAAQAFVLDRLHPGWRAQAIPGGASLEALLRAVVDGLAGVPAPLRSMAVRTVLLDGTRWRVAVADAPDHWAQGLQGVELFGSVDGVWFVFPEDVDAAFWMRGARVPLDIAFLDADGRVLASLTMPTCNADPCPTYRPERPYRSALETFAGRSVGTGTPERLTVP
jgi:uncharacterized membrane protein (UPF0127 family)